MKILLISDCYLPGTKSSAKMIHDLAVALAARNHQPIIVAPDDTLATPSLLQHQNGLTVLRIKSAPIKDIPRPIRAINECMLSATIWKRGRHYFCQNPCELIIYYSPSIFFGPIVSKLKQRWHCPSYLVLRDIFPQWALDVGILKKGLVYRFFKKKEAQTYAAADIIAVQSPANLDYFRRNNFNRSFRLEVLYNWTAVQPLHTAMHCNDRHRLGLDGKTVFFYGGNIGLAQDIENILRLANNTRHRPDIYFLIIGDGSEVPLLTKKIRSLSLTNITLHPAVSQEHYLDILRQFDVGLICLSPELKTHNFPGKMLGYMNCSMPILASINEGNDLQRIIEQANAGLACINGRDDQLCHAALKLADNPCLRKQMGKNARTLLEEKFSAESAASQILAHTENLPATPSALHQQGHPIQATPPAGCSNTH